MQFWNDYNFYDCTETLAWTQGDVLEECMNGVWKITLGKFIHDFKEIFQEQRFQKPSKVSEKKRAVVLGEKGEGIKKKKNQNKQMNKTSDIDNSMMITIKKNPVRLRWNNVNLTMDEEHTEKLLVVVPEELTHEELLQLKQKCRAEEQTRGKQTSGEKPQSTLQKIHSDGVSISFHRP